MEATTAIRQAEVLAAKRMIERAMDRFDLYPARLMGDSAYGSAEMLDWMLYERGIEPQVTVFDKSARNDGTFSRDDFTYDHQARPLLLSRWDGAAHDRNARERRGDLAVQCASARMRGMRAQAQVLPEHAGAQDTALDP